LEELFFLGILSEAIFYGYELYDEEEIAGVKEFFLRLGVALLVGGTIILALYFYPPLRELAEHFLADSRWGYIALLLLLVTAMHKPSLNELLDRIYPPRRVLIVGAGELPRLIASEVAKHKWPRYKIVGFVQPQVGEGEEPFIGVEVLRLQGQLPQLAAERGVDKIVVAGKQRRGSLPLEGLLACKMQGVEVLEAQDFYEQLSGQISVRDLRPSWLIFSPGFKQSPGLLAAKGFIDVVFALIGLVVTSPLMLLVALLIKLDSSGPMLFKQERIGQGGHPFILLKFRTMCHGAEDKSGPVWARENDKRITRVGRMIRKFRLDELPQMLNVLRGEMSFIGPRPERPYFVERLQRAIPYYKQRLALKPGITGWAAVNYQYGASLDDAVEKLQYDLYYIKNLSLFLDFLIILKTIQVTCTGKGAR